MAQQMPNTPQLIRPLMGGLSRIDPRLDLASQVALRFADLERRVSAQALNISARGMFIRSREARPAGSPLAFELSLSGAGRPIQGAAEVVWSRRFELAADRPAGMGIRFLDLDEKSRSKLQSFMAEHTDPCSPVADATVTASSYVDPLSSLTSSEQRRLYAFAGYASAGPERPWNRRLRRVLSTARKALSRHGFQ